MGTNLSRELRKYYTRKGNRILFSNKMTLNQLAWEVWERLGCEEVDPSVLSRVLGGSRILSPKQLRCFCQILNINGFKRSVLFQSLYEDVLLRTGMSSKFLCSRDEIVIKLIEENYIKIQDAQEKGLPLLVIDWSQLLVDKIDELLPYVYTIENQKRLLGLEGRLLVIIDQCKIVSDEPDKVLFTIDKSARKLREIGSYLGNKDFIGTSYLNLGNSYYDCEDYQKALEFFSKASALMSITFGNNISETPFRALALSSAYLKKKKEYQYAKKVLINNLGRYPIDIKGYIMEALGRCEAMFGNRKESERLLSQSEDLLKEIKVQKLKYESLREVQLTRSLIEANLLLGSKVSSNYLNKLGDVGINIAEGHGYMFYGNKIKELLNRVMI